MLNPESNGNLSIPIPESTANLSKRNIDKLETCLNLRSFCHNIFINLTYVILTLVYTGQKFTFNP